MNTKFIVYAVLTAAFLASGAAFALDPFDGGFAVNPQPEIFTLGERNDSLWGWGFGWFSADSSIVLIGSGPFPESYPCGEDRDIAVADFDGDFLDELVVAWNRPDGGVFVGIPTIDPETMAPDPAGWHVPDPPVAAGVLYANDSLAGVLGEIRVVAGNFYDDGSSEFILAYLAADSTVSLTVFDVDTSTLIPGARGTISDQAIHTVMPEIQRFGTASRFDIATGDLDGDVTDEIVLIASDPTQTPESYLMVSIYDYDTTSQTLSRLSQNSYPANMRASEVSCLRRIAATTGDFDADSLYEVAFTDDWARTDKDTLHYACTHFLDFSGDMLSVVDSWDRDSSGFAHLQSGMSGTVEALTVYNGDLIAGGAFTHAGGKLVNYIARWDGTQWHALDGGMSGTVYALSVYNGELIAGGSFNEAGGEIVGYIARWNETDGWRPLESPKGIGVSSNVYALTVYNLQLIAGGSFNEAGGEIVHYIARWDLTNGWWRLELPDVGLSGDVYALTVYNDEVIAAGAFTKTGGVNQLVVNRIARWNEDDGWRRLEFPTDVGLNADGKALTVYNGQVIAGGDFHYAGGVIVNHIARWDTSGGWWRLETPGVGIGLDERVKALTVYNDEVIAAGYFHNADGGLVVNHIARWDSTDGWRQLEFPTGVGTNDNGYALTVYPENNAKVIAGGNFTQAGGVSADRIAAWDTAWSTLPCWSDFIVDILADDVDFAPDGADEIIVRGYQDPNPVTGVPADAFMVFGVDDSFTGCIRSGTYIQAVWGSDGIHGSRRTMAVGDIDEDDNNYKDLLFLRKHRLIPEATMILAHAIDTAVLAPCSAPADDPLPGIASWTDSSNTLTELVMADLDTSTIVLGRPTYFRITDIMQPLAVINAPPVHFDVLNDKTDTFDINFRYFENPDNCETFAVYQKRVDYTTEMSTEVRRDWGVSSSLDVSVGTPGATVKAHLGGKYGEQFSKVDETGQTIEFTATVTTGDDDQIYATQIDYDIWEYPILRNGVQLEGGGIVVVSPQPSQDVFSACKNPNREQWIPNHEVENLLSYPSYGNLTDNHMIASDSVLTSTTGFVPENYPYNANWTITQSNFSSETLEDEWRAGVDVSASYETGGSFLFGLIDWGVKVNVGFEYNRSEVQTYKTTVTDACSLGVFLGCINTNLGVCNYTVTPYAYWANNGALVLDYTTSPMVAGQGEDPTWWQVNYGDRDPAFVLPWRLDDVKGEPLASEEARYKTREILFHPDLPNPGEVVKITARIHNFSLEPILDPVGVSFYLGDPGNGGQPIYEDGSGDSIFYTSGGILPQDVEFVTFNWQLPGEGSITSCQRIWAVIDPLDEISPEVHDNDDWATNNKGWKLLYVNTATECIDRDGDGWEESAFRCCDALNKWDNCPDVYNPDQTDTDGDGIGDACEDIVYVCGDANGDSQVNVGDAVFLIAYVFKGGPAPDPVCEGNANGDTDTNVGDAVYIIAYVFKGGPAPIEGCCN